MGTLPIVEVRVKDIIDKTFGVLEKNIGAVKSYRVRKYLLDIIKEDLIQILADVVDVSLAYFNANRASHYKGRTVGEMGRSLRRGIQVKGKAYRSVVAILHGVDYTLMHEENYKYKPTGSRYIAIPLTKEFGGSACRADGTPIHTRPSAWNAHHKTWTITGREAFETYGRKPVASEINPEGIDSVKYIVARDRDLGGIVWLYKLVPVSYFVDNHSNVEGRRLRKLHLRARIEAALQRAAAGWSRLLYSLLDDVSLVGNIEDLDSYAGITFDTVEVKYNQLKTYSKSVIPKGRLNTAVSEMVDFAHWTASVISM